MKFTALSLGTALLASSALAVPLSKRQVQTQTVTYDDQDVQVTYTGNWTALTNQGEALQSGTESYTNDGEGAAWITAPGEIGVAYTTDITIWALQKPDRTNGFEIYLGTIDPLTSLIGTGGEWAAEETTTTAIVFNATAVPYVGGQPFIIKNYNDRVYGAQFLGFDAIKFDYTQA